jgi:uncharacterized membrane protein YfcA
LTPLEWVFTEAVVVLGSALQGAVGFGLGLLGAPLLVIVDPSLVPGPLLAAALFLTILVALREHPAIDFRGVSWALVGRVPGTFLGAAVIAAIPRRETALLVGAMVLVAVGLVATGARVARTRPALFGAGTVSGFMATTSSIGGPAIALLYQDSHGGKVRGTLSGFFLVGLVISLSALSLVGRFGRAEIVSSLTLFPAVAVGFLLSARIAAVLDRGHTRKAILAISALAGAAVIAEAIVSGA